MLFKKKVLEREVERKPIDVDGETVFLQEMSARDRISAYVDSVPDGKTFDSGVWRYCIMVRSVFDEKGQKVFSHEDAIKLANLPTDKDIERLASESLEMNGLVRDAVEEEAKN